jgi:hypothetical protein
VELAGVDLRPAEQGNQRDQGPGHQQDPGEARQDQTASPPERPRDPAREARPARLNRVAAEKPVEIVGELGRRRIAARRMRSTSDACLDAALMHRRADLAAMRQAAPRLEAVCGDVIRELPRLGEPHCRLGRLYRAMMRWLKDPALAEALPAGAAMI